MPPSPDHLTRRDALKSFLAAGLAAGTVRTALAEEAAPPQARSHGPWRMPPDSKSWAAHWITHPDAARAAQGVYLFRNALTLDTVPASLLVKVLTDQRFKLFVNGQLIGCGPALSDPGHWRYERFDLAPALRPGVNIAPHLGNLDWVSGAQAHPQGEIAVRFRKRSGRLEMEIVLPGNVTGTLLFQGKSRPIQGRFQGVI